MSRNRFIVMLGLFVLICIIGSVLTAGLMTHISVHAAAGAEPTWALPFPTGTSVSIGPKGIHGDNFRSIQDDRTHTVYRFTNPTDPNSLDLVLEPERRGTSSIATTPLANGTVLAVWTKCHVVLIDYGNGWWAIYLHLVNISVSSGDAVTVNTKIGYPTTNVKQNNTCGNENSSAEHVHFAFLNGSGTKGSYIPMLGRVLCGHSVIEQNNDATNIILQGLTQTKDQVFTIPQCTPSSSASWPMFGYDTQHTHYNTSENALNPSNVANLVQDWTATTKNPFYEESSPAVANGVVYVSSSDGTLHAFNASTGATLWTANIGSGDSSSPAVVNNVVYIGSPDSHLYSFNASTGATLWAATMGAGTGSSPTVVNGVVYIGCGDHKLYAFNATTGALLWTATTGDVILSSPAVANGAVYIGSNDGKLYAFNATTGATLWTASAANLPMHEIDSSPAVANGIVYVGSTDFNLYAFNATTGALLWTASTTNDITSSPAVANGVVYIGSQDFKLYAFNATTGALLWTASTGSFINSPSPAIANGVVYIGSSDHKLYAINAATGTIIWTYATGSDIESSPVVANGIVYIDSQDSTFYAFHLASTTS